MAHALFLKRPIKDENGHEVGEEDPLFLELVYSSHNEAYNAKLTLEKVYGVDRIEIDTSQDYNARMNRY